MPESAPKELAGHGTATEHLPEPLMVPAMQKVASESGRFRYPGRAAAVSGIRVGPFPVLGSGLRTTRLGNGALMQQLLPYGGRDSDNTDGTDGSNSGEDSGGGAGAGGHGSHPSRTWHETTYWHVARHHWQARCDSDSDVRLRRERAQDIMMVGARRRAAAMGRAAAAAAAVAVIAVAARAATRPASTACAEGFYWAGPRRRGGNGTAAGAHGCRGRRSRCWALSASSPVGLAACACVAGAWHWSRWHWSRWQQESPVALASDRDTTRES